MCVCTYICVLVCACVYLCVDACVCESMCFCKCIRVYVHTYIIYVRTYIQYIDANIYACVCNILVFIMYVHTYFLHALSQEDDERVLKRDTSAPTLEDHFDKTILPQVMQVWQAVCVYPTSIVHRV